MKKALCIVDISKDVDVDVHNLFLSKLLSLVGSKLFLQTDTQKLLFLTKLILKFKLFITMNLSHGLQRSNKNYLC